MAIIHVELDTGDNSSPEKLDKPHKPHKPENDKPNFHDKDDKFDKDNKFDKDDRFDKFDKKPDIKRKKRDDVDLKFTDKDEVTVDPESTYMNPKINSRKELIDWCLVHLGFPLITVELTEQHFNVAIADSLSLYSKYASFPKKCIIANLRHYKPGEGLDLSRWNVTYVKEIATRKDSMWGLGNNDILFGWPAFMNGQFGGMPYFGSSNSYSNNWVGGFVTFHNFHEFAELSRRMAGSNPDWEYDKFTKKLKLFPEPRMHEKDEPILLTAECEPSIEELYTEEYFRRLVLANCKILLGNIRKKFSSVQLVGGGQIDTSIGDEGREELNQIKETILQDTNFGQEFYIV